MANFNVFDWLSSQGVLPGSVVGTNQWLSAGLIIRGKEAGWQRFLSWRISEHVFDVGGYDSNGKLTAYQMLPKTGYTPVKASEYGLCNLADHIVFVAMPKILRMNQHAQQLAAQFCLDECFQIHRQYGFDDVARNEIPQIPDNPDRRDCSVQTRFKLDAIAYAYPPEWNQNVTPYDMQRHFEASGEIVWKNYRGNIS